MRISDWSSDVCSSDLSAEGAAGYFVTARSQKTPDLRRIERQRIEIEPRRRCEREAIKVGFPVGIERSRYVIAQRHRRTRRNIGQGGIADAIDAESEFECGRIDARLDHQRIRDRKSRV